MASGEARITVRPLVPERWDDVADLFGTRGVTGNCYCMFWRASRSEFDAAWRERRNADSLKRLVDAGRPTGLLAYADGRAVGWCGLAPRADLPRLDASRTRRAVDDTPVWSIVCFFTRRGYRGKGVTRALVDAAVRYARDEGAPALEAYPIDPDGRAVNELSAYVGLRAMFETAGFEVVSSTPRQTFGSNLVMRRKLGGRRRRSAV